MKGRKGPSGKDPVALILSTLSVGLTCGCAVYLSNGTLNDG